MTNETVVFIMKSLAQDLKSITDELTLPAEAVGFSAKGIRYMIGKPIEFIEELTGMDPAHIPYAEKMIKSQKTYDFILDTKTGKSDSGPHTIRTDADGKKYIAHDLSGEPINDDTLQIVTVNRRYCAYLSSEPGELEQAGIAEKTTATGPAPIFHQIYEDTKFVNDWHELNKAFQNAVFSKDARTKKA